MNAVVPFATVAEKSLAEQFRAFRSSQGPGEAAGRRDDAFAAFAAAGLPHRRIEAWHYTDLRALMREALPPAAAPGAGAIAGAKVFIATLPPAPGGRVVLLDGAYAADLSDLGPLAPGISVGSAREASANVGDLAAAEALGRGESVVSLNAAFCQGGAEVEIAAGVVSATPVEILSITSGRTAASVYLRHSVRLGARASVSIVERHAVLERTRTQANSVLVVSVGDGASLDHVCLVTDLGAEMLHVGTALIRLGREAKLLSSTLIATAGTTRRQTYLEFAGPSSTAHFRGASLLDGQCHADTTLVLTHTAPHYKNRKLYKHILNGHSTGIYQGKVVVTPDTQKTNGKMLSKAVFLDEGSAMYNKPELEIFADDVVCGHGATVGALDDDQLFYLRARGIPLKEAQALLLEAFVDEAIEDVADERLRGELTDRVSRWLRQRGT